MMAGADVGAHRFLADRSSPRRARRFVDRLLVDHGYDEQCRQCVALLVSELVTNAYVHAQSATEIEVTTSGDVVRVVVCDFSPAMPVRRSPDPARTTGRGLLLVEQLANRWGVTPKEAGKAVWFELRCPGRTPR